MLRLLALIGFIVLVVPGVASAASFPCAKAVDVVGLAICADPNVSAAEVSLGYLYEDLLRISAHSYAVRAEQRAGAPALR